MRHGLSAYRNGKCHDGPDGGPCLECRAAGTADSRRRRIAAETSHPEADQRCDGCGLVFRRVGRHVCVEEVPV